MNGPLLNCMKEFQQEYGKCGQYFKKNGWAKAEKAVRELTYEVTDGLSLGKGKTKLPGVGKSIAASLHEFITTGKVDKLEQLKADNA